MRARAHRAPADAATYALNALAEPDAEAPAVRRRSHALDLYCHLTGIGAVAEASTLDAFVVAALVREEAKPSRKQDHRRIIQLRTALGTVAANHHGRSRQAAAHFALAERAAVRSLRSVPSVANLTTARWRARAERVQIWLVIGRQDRARDLAGPLRTAVRDGALPAELAAKAEALFRQLAP